MQDANEDEPTFEAIVAALLQVDPEGITGQRAARKGRHYYVVRQLGAPESFLSTNGTWGTIGTVAEFESAEEAAGAAVPPGTAGEPVGMND